MPFSLVAQLRQLFYTVINFFWILFRRLYDAPGVCDVKASFNSFQNDYCFHNGNNGFAYEYPTVNYYQGNPTCDGAPSTSQTVPTTCVPVAAYPADTLVASQFFYGYVPYVPSDAPTVSPTAAPTPESYSAGYVYANFYTGKGCTGDIVAVTGRPTDTCLVAYEDGTTAEPTGSYMFTCSGGKVMFICVDCLVRVYLYSSSSSLALALLRNTVIM